MLIDNTITQILSKITDPILKLTALEMGLSSSFTLDGSHLTLCLTAGFPTGLLQESFVQALTDALRNTLPNHSIEVILNSKIRAHQTQLTGKGLRGIKNTIAIASGKGGVGKSTVTVNLAIALARAGARVGILDADIYGPSIPLMLGKTAPLEISNEHYLPVSKHGIYAMSIGYLTDQETALIWRGPMLAKSLIQMLDITHWDNLDYLLIDLPPGTGDIQLSLVQKIPLTAAIVVTTPQNVATMDAQKALKMFKTTNIHALGLVENMSLHICSQCSHEDTIFGQGGAQHLATTYHCNLLGQLPLDAQIGRDCDQGHPTTLSNTSKLAMPFIKTAMLASIALSKRPLNYMDKFPPIIVT